MLVNGAQCGTSRTITKAKLDVYAVVTPCLTVRNSNINCVFLRAFTAAEC